MSERSKTFARALGEAVAVVVGVMLVAWAVRANDAWLERHMTPMYCLTEPAELGRLRVARWVAAASGAVVLLFVRPRFGRWLARTCVGRPIGSVVAGALRILIPVVLAVIAADLVLRFRRSRAVWTPPGPVPHVSVDRHGFRVRGPDDAPDLTARTVLFSGESVVYGWGLEDHQTIPALVAAHTGVATVNLGVTGASNDEAYYHVRRWLPEFSRPAAVVTFVVYNWLQRNVGLHRQRLVLTGSGALEIAAPAPKFFWTSPLWETLRAVYHTEDAVELTRAILREEADYIQSRGAYPLFVLTQIGPRCAARGAEGPPIARRLVEGQSFASIALDLEPGMMLPEDQHPNARGAEHYAAAIERALRDAGVLRSDGH